MIKVSEPIALKPTDQDLWNQFRAGNSDALFAVYKRLHVSLVNYCFKLCGDKQLAQDSFSELLIQLWDKREKLSDVKNVKSYLITTLRRQLISNSKLSHQFDQISEEHTGAEDPYEDVIINAQDQEQLKKQIKLAFARLTPRQRQLPSVSTMV